MRSWLFKKIFSEWIPFKWIDGHKTDIARFAAFVSGVLVVVTQFFPEYAPFIDQGQAGIAALLSLLGIELGKLHKADKGIT